jgi:hypothetical protein
MQIREGCPIHVMGEALTITARLPSVPCGYELGASSSVGACLLLALHEWPAVANGKRWHPLGVGRFADDAVPGL